jgi:diguanylate cyclase (GGDEF)-like protein
LLVLNLDNVKQVNDIHGRQEGDKVMVVVADIILQSIRESDFDVRFDGDGW